MTSPDDLANALAEAQRNATSSVDPAPYAELDLAAALAVQTYVTRTLGRPVGMLKTAVLPGGGGAAAPIYASRMGRSGDFRLPVATLTGLEVEIGLVLARDVASASDIPGAIDHYFVGVEICGTRYTDRTKSGQFGGLADAMSAYGYCIGPRRADDSFEGLTIRLELAGREIYAAPAKHGFGSVLASLRAYANAQHAALPLLAGTIVTTGSMCGLVPTTGRGHVVAHLGGESVTFELI